MGCRCILSIGCKAQPDPSRLPLVGQGVSYEGPHAFRNRCSARCANSSVGLAVRPLLDMRPLYSVPDGAGMVNAEREAIGRYPPGDATGKGGQEDHGRSGQAFATKGGTEGVNQHSKREKARRQQEREWKKLDRTARRSAKRKVGWQDRHRFPQEGG
jgi:hypothetical protein